MNWAADDWATARETADFLGADASELPGPPKVTLKDGAATIDVDAETFAKVWDDTFGNRRPVNYATPLALLYLSQAAAKLGFADLSKKLDRFRAAVKGQAAIVREDGQPWTPPSVRKQEGGRFPKPTAADREQTTADVADYFANEQGETAAGPDTVADDFASFFGKENQ